MTGQPKARHCPHCGAPMKEYSHPLTAGLCAILRRVWDVGGGPIHFSELGLTYNQCSNLQKLRYFGLLAKADHRNSKSGVWVLTGRGRWFMTGKFKIPKNAISYRGQLVRRQGQFISIHDIERAGKYYVTPEEWAERATGKAPPQQMRLRLAV